MSKDKNPNTPDNIIPFPNSDMTNQQARLIELDGIVEVPESVTLEQFEEAFAEFIEKNGWYFGGGIEDITDD